MKINQMIMVLLAVGNIEMALAQDTYYEQQEKGWHWYHEEKPVRNRKLKRRTPSPLSATEQLKQVQTVVEEAKAKAVLMPTHQNLMQYITIQNKVSENSQQFANMWQQVLLYHPQLNYQLKAPTNQMARHVYLDEDTRKQNKAIEELAKTTGLFFFYKGTCPYCQQFAPVLRLFSESTHMTVIPITLDGLVLPEFPASKMDAGQAARFNVDVTPALFTVNPKTGKAIPVAYGMVSRDELRARILQIIQEGQ